ncbi:MAG: hypothetical protein NDI63_02380 [Pseudobdellovibrio sp.]|nr:hypothetical protein [Pseudobdellovibrio sp.]
METKSKSKLIFKIFFILAAVVIFSIAGFIAFIFYHLPAANQLSAGILQQSTKAHVAASNPASPQATGAMEPPPPVVTDPNNPPPVKQEKTETKVQTFNSRAGLDDLIDPNKPLSNFCSSLKNAKAGKMTGPETNRAFQLSLDEATADPRAQSLKPLFRYILRMPELQELIAVAEKSAGQSEEGFSEKAEFYGKAVSAFMAMRAHKQDFEAIADRSYLFYKLNSAVAQKPELLADERLKKFCEDTETAFNTNAPVQFDQEKKNFERLLSEVGVDSLSIGYDPNYKTEFDIVMGKSNLNLTGGWLQEVFAK